MGPPRTHASALRLEDGHARRGAAARARTARGDSMPWNLEPHTLVCAMAQDQAGGSPVSRTDVQHPQQVPVLTPAIQAERAARGATDVQERHGACGCRAPRVRALMTTL